MSTYADKLLSMGYDSMACFPDPSAVGAEAKVAKIADELLGMWVGSGHKAKFIKKCMESFADFAAEFCRKFLHLSERFRDVRVRIARLRPGC